MVEIKVPQQIDKLIKLGFWEMDEIIVFTIPIMILTLTLQINIIVSFILGIVLMILYRKEKKTANRGFLFHLGFMTGIAKFKGFNSVHVRGYNE